MVSLCGSLVSLAVSVSDFRALELEIYSLAYTIASISTIPTYLHSRCPILNGTAINCWMHECGSATSFDLSLSTSHLLRSL